MKHEYGLFEEILTEKERKELSSLDYVLTWGYTDDYDQDLKRYKELSEKRWIERERT